MSRVEGVGLPEEVTGIQLVYVCMYVLCSCMALTHSADHTQQVKSNRLFLSDLCVCEVVYLYMYVLTQVTCMAETQTFSQNDMSAWEPSTSPPLHTAQDLLCEIPCEYCNNSIAASMLCEHQATCDENPLVKQERRRHGRQGTRDNGEDRGVHREGGGALKAQRVCVRTYLCLCMCVQTCLCMCMCVSVPIVHAYICTYSECLCPAAL